MCKPLYTDKLTKLKERTTYAHMLIEVNATKTRVNELNILLPTKEHTNLEFIYEYEVKYCVDCKTLGHTGGCNEKNSNKKVGD